LAGQNLADQFENQHFLDVDVLNFEMESSALFFLSEALGHAATTLCLGIANRPERTFSENYKKEMEALIGYVMERI